MEGPDEFEHFAHVVWLAEGHGLPPQGRAAYDTPLRQEASQPPLYYWLASLPVRLIGTDPPLVFRPNPHFRYELDPVLPDNKNTAVHYPADSSPLQGSWLSIYLARALSVLTGLGLIICVFGLAQSVMPVWPQAPLAAALFVAMMPQVVFHSSLVSNDILATALCTLVLWLTSRMVRQGVTPWRAAGVGVVLGLAALTKINALILGLPLVIAWVWFWFVYPRQRRMVIAAGLSMSLAFLLVAGWWFGRNWLLYGSPFGLDTHCYQEAAYCGNLALRWPVWVQWRDIFYSFWGAFALANIRPYPWVYLFFAALILLALVGLGRAGLRWWQKAERSTETAVLLLMLSSSVIASLVLLEFWLQQLLATYGRLLYPSLGAFVVLLIYGLWRVQPRLARWAWLLPAVLAWAAPFWLIRPAFALPTILTPAQVADLGEPVGWQFGDFVELLSLTPQLEVVAAGELLPVQVCWRPLSQTEQDQTMLLHLIGPGNTVVADRYTYPGLGSYPTSIWTPNRPFCDVVRVPIPEDLEQTLLYHVVVGWLDENGERLPATDSEGNPVDYALAAMVKLATDEERGTAVSPPAISATSTAPIRLLSSQLPQQWQAGKTHNFTLQWWVAEPVNSDYTLFIHLLDAQTGDLVAQADGPPLAGWYPTSWWAEGEQVVDLHTFPLPADIPPGLYDLVVGWYNPATGERLGEAIPLGNLTIEDK